MTQVPLSELEPRMNRFRAEMTVRNPEWEFAVIFGRINLFYFTGTMQEGMLLVPREGEAVFWVRRSYERALDESAFPQIRPMESYRDAASSLKQLPKTVHLEMEVVSMAQYNRFRKHFPFQEAKAADSGLGLVRAVKSAYELALMEKAGLIHRFVLEERVPELLQEGMSEVDLGTDLFSIMMAEGHHGVARFGMSGAETLIGQLGFGENTLYPTCFDGPGGNRGISPAVPLLGDRTRRLKRGDLVFVDTGFGMDGYHTDKTMTYVFGGSLPAEAVAVHEQCLAVQDQVAAALKPGAIPSEIYKRIIEAQNPEFLENFMGFGRRKVKFIGHGVGLLIDEVPVIADGFDEPLQEGMVLAVEPKNGLKGVGMVGIENTFVVTPEGGRSITGHGRGLIAVE